MIPTIGTSLMGGFLSNNKLVSKQNAKLEVDLNRSHSSMPANIGFTRYNLSLQDDAS